MPFVGSYLLFCCSSYDLHHPTREGVSCFDYWPGTLKYRHRRKISFMKIGVFSEVGITFFIWWVVWLVAWAGFLSVGVWATTIQMRTIVFFGFFYLLFELAFIITSFEGLFEGFSPLTHHYLANPFDLVRYCFCFFSFYFVSFCSVMWVHSIIHYLHS